MHLNKPKTAYTQGYEPAYTQGYEPYYSAKNGVCKLLLKIVMSCHALNGVCKQLAFGMTYSEHICI